MGDDSEFPAAGSSRRRTVRRRASVAVGTVALAVPLVACDPAVVGAPAESPGAPTSAAPRRADDSVARSFPTRATTGYRACGRDLDELTPMEGTVTLGDGEVLEGFDLRGVIKVSGADVVIRCGRIRTRGLYAITATRKGDERYTVEDVEMEGIATDADRNSAAIGPYGSWTARRVDVWRFKDGIKLASRQVVEDSWIHDLWKVGDSHNDGMQSVGGRDVVIRGNTIEGPWRASTSALMLTSGSGGYLERYVVEGNRLSGGTYSVYIRAKEGRPVPEGVEVRDNVWVRDSQAFGPLSLDPRWPEADPEAVWEGNTYDDGAELGH